MASRTSIATRSEKSSKSVPPRRKPSPSPSPARRNVSRPAFIDEDEAPGRVRVSVRLRPKTAEEHASDADFADFVELHPEINGVKYPTLQNIARDIYAIPVSMVASESAFSTSGHLISPNRNKLKEETVEALICSQNWLWVLEKGESIKPVNVDDYMTINKPRRGRYR